jgi:hypothetical protein
MWLVDIGVTKQKKNVDVCNTESHYFHVQRMQPVEKNSIPYILNIKEKRDTES